MKSIIPTYLTILGFAFITLLCGAMLAVQLQISGARTFHASCLNRLQASYYNGAVWDACVDEANARGYTLSEEKVSMYKGRYSRLVTLDYQVVVPFLGIDPVEGTVTGYGK